MTAGQGLENQTRRGRGFTAVRLWSLHPQYLDPHGLVALWREGLLAQAVLAGKTRGYTRHPQLDRFRDEPAAISVYLHAIAEEASRRGYRFDATKLPRLRRRRCVIEVSEGQLRYEWQHLRAKLKVRSAEWHRRTRGVALPDAHPMFVVVAGPVAEWERR